MTEFNVQEYLSVLKDSSKIEITLIDENYLHFNLNFAETDSTIQSMYSLATDYLFIRDWRITPYQYISLNNFSKLCNEDYHFQQMTQIDIPFSHEEVQQIMDVICRLFPITMKA